ncbi:hypothetical protein ZOSMA_1133G00030 [Zostera marina]|uniref:Uncharacterized protein n=1 Tax=Zostera marina TaxID=29655 RepID=A0A0K9Q312_ZOSMR|nr:hypothetical protein ZOSMA_1133G00030 [Zostera marina]
MHLDNALKDCMEKMRIGKEESKQKLYDVVFANTQHWEKLNLELEVRVNVLEEQLHANAENDALSRSLQDCSGLLMKLSEDRAQVQSQIEVLKTKFQAMSEKELSSIKYELNVVSKQVEIRTEEKNMSVQSV